MYHVYAKDSRAVVMLISSAYVDKVWCKHECRAAIARALKEDGYILPVRFDDAWPQGLVETTRMLGQGALSDRHRGS